MNKKKIIIDLDDTLNNLKDIWVANYNVIYNDYLNPKDITSWDMVKYVKPECGEKIYELLNKEGLFYNLTPLENSIEITKLLSEMYDLHICSAFFHPQNVVEKVKWLNKYFPHINYRNMLFGSCKYLVKGDVMIDDYDKNLSTFDGVRILFNQPHNQDIETNIDVRAKNWVEIFEFLGGDNAQKKSNILNNIYY